MWLAAVSLALLLAAALPAHAADAGSIQVVYECAVRNLPPSAHARAALTSRSQDGKESTLEVDYWSLTPDVGLRRIVIARRGAPSDSVSAYLFSDGDAVGEAWSYTRGDGAAKRLATSGADTKLFASSLSLEDFARFARVVFPGQVRRLPDAELSGHPAYVVQTQPAPASGSGYSRIVTFIDQEWCTVLRRDSYEKAFEGASRPRKTYQADRADVRFDGRYANAVRAEQHDARDGSSTKMEVLALEIPAKVSESFFTPESLPSAVK
jgi:hypothetical protein